MRHAGIKMVVLGAAWILATTQGGVASAADGDLDTTFDTDGKVVTTFPGGAFARAVAIQADGRIVAVGAAAGASEAGEFAVARYMGDGTLDDAFGTGGLLTTPLGPDGQAEARAVAVQPDGKIVVAGTADRKTFAVARYETDGTLDPSFGGGDGIVLTDVTGGLDVAYAVEVQPNGRIVVAGSAGPRWRPAFALVRYRPRGTPDPRFGDLGVVLTRFGVWGVARAIVLQPDRRIVVAGIGGTDGFALARYLPGGRLDRSFGGDGKATAPTYGGAFAVALQPNGKIVAAGAYDFFRFAVARFRPTGKLDPNFSRDGYVVTDVGGSEQGAIGLAIEGSGKIVAVGHAGPHEGGTTEQWRFVLARYRPGGRLDPNFGTGGLVEGDFDDHAWAAGSAVDAGGNVVAVGGYGEGNAEGFAVARFLM